MRRILLVNSSGHLGGAEKILMAFLSNVDKDAFKFFAAVPSRGRFSALLEQSGIEIDIVGRLYEKGFVTRDDALFSRPRLMMNSISGLLEFSKEVSKAIEKYEIDVVLSCGAKACVAGGIAARRNKKKCIWIMQDILPNNLYSKMFYTCAKFFSDRMIVISKAIKNAFPKFLHPKVEVISPFLERHELDEIINTVSLRNELKIKDDEIVLGVVGKVVPSKGVDIFLKTLPELKKAHPNLKALIAGDSELEVANPDYLDELKKLVKSMGLEADVKFLGWRDDVYNVFATMDIFVHTPTRPEGFGRALLEAMAASKPVIAFDLGAVRELIDDGTSGILVEPSNRDDLVIKIKDLIRDEGRRNALGEAARRSVEERFNEANFTYSTFLYLLSLYSN